MDTLFVGQSLIELASVDSTNSYAINLLKSSKVVEGLVIYTKHQYNGRGQRGNTWLSEPFKNLTFSIILYPSFLSIEKQFLLNKIAALAIHDFLSQQLKDEFSAGLKIKWPNDVYVNTRKIAGILIENNIRERQLASTVIGIGLNVNQTAFPGNAGNACSLQSLTGETYDLKSCLEQLCSCLEARYLQLKAQKENDIDAAYEAALYLRRQWRNFRVGNEVILAQVQGVSQQGNLILLKKDGITQQFAFQELAFMP